MPVSLQRRPLERHSVDTGRWVRARDVDAGVEIEVGSTGNLLDATRRVPLARHRLARQQGVLTLRAVWPVAEVLTHRVGGFVEDLRAELVSAASPDPDADLAHVAAQTAAVLAPTPGVNGEDRGGDLVAQVLSASYPLLAAPIDAGARPTVVPVALEPMLRHTEVRAAATATLGPRVTRPLVRALASALLPDVDGRIAWEPLLCALMAADRCGPEQLTQILEARPPQVGAVSFGLTDIGRARAMFAETRPRRVAELLCDRLSSEGGTLEFATRLVEWNALPPRPPVEPTPPRVAPRQIQILATPAIDPLRQPVQYPQPWIDADGMTAFGHTVCMPRTPNELLEWGSAMNNCLGAYRSAVASGRTRILGFRMGQVLRFAAEISPGRVLRTLEAADNTTPGRDDAARVIGFLRERYLIDADGRRT